MKNRFFLTFTGFVTLLFFSCKNANNNELSYTNVETLKEKIAEKEATLSWTKELEGSKLTDSIEFPQDKIKQNIERERYILTILNESEKVYPEFENFGSLDTSSIKHDIYDRLQKFCEALNINIYNGPESFFDSQYLFEYVFFREEFKKGWEENFNQDFPHIIDYKPEITEATGSNEKNESKEKSETKEGDALESKNNESENKDAKKMESIAQKDKLFSKWIFGQPFIFEEIIEIPVRFYCKYGSVDVTFYINTKKLNNIYLAVIDRWNKKSNA